MIGCFWRDCAEQFKTLGERQRSNSAECRSESGVFLMTYKVTWKDTHKTRSALVGTAYRTVHGHPSNQVSEGFCTVVHDGRWRVGCFPISKCTACWIQICQLNPNLEVARARGAHSKPFGIMFTSYRISAKTAFLYFRCFTIQNPLSALQSGLRIISYFESEGR